MSVSNLYNYFRDHMFDFGANGGRTVHERRAIDRSEPLLAEPAVAMPLALPYADARLGKLVDLLRDSHWRHEEIQMTDDAHDYRKLDAPTRSVLNVVLRFFAVGDSLIVENLVCRFANEIQLEVARTFYSFQIANEEEHKLTYARLINTIVEDAVERERLLRDDASMRCMVMWIQRWIYDRRRTIGERLLAFVFVEGVFFTSCFAFIYWLRSKNQFPGLGKSNEFIARDENLHALFACELYHRHVLARLSRSKVLELATDAMNVCDAFVDCMFSNGVVALVGMNSSLMKEYVRCVANYYLKQLGELPVFVNANNPFPFMIQQSLEGKTNFFESDVSEYKKAVNVQAIQYNEDYDF